LITITLNGKPQRIEQPSSVVDLLACLDINSDRVAVAVNGEVVPRETWSQAAINEGDSVEVVRAVGGG